MLTRYWPQIKKIILDILFPPACLSCENIIDGDEEKYLCEKCRARIVINDTLFCAECKARLPENSKICHPKTLARLAAATQYDEPAAKKLIWRLKYEKLLAALNPLSELISKYVSELDYDFSDYKIVSIPIHAARLRERGFNQAELIGKILAQKLNLEILPALVKIKNTKKQAETKTREEREANILGCFEINPEIAGKLANQKIILADDVFTSGATTLEAARILKFAGVKNIIIFTIAKGK
jgi:ComF family protein